MKKGKSGSHRKCDSAKHKKKAQKYRGERRDTREQQRATEQIERVHNEAEFAERNFAPRDATEVCPLCNQAITEEDKRGNVHKITFDHRPVLVHRVCPGEKANGRPGEKEEAR